MANLSEVFIAALRLAAALFGTNKDHANSSSQAPEPSQGAAQEASHPSTSGRSASNPEPPAKSTASRDVHISGNQVWDVARRGLPEFSHRAVFTLGGIFLIGDPGPHHFARVGVVIGDRLVAKFG